MNNSEENAGFGFSDLLFIFAKHLKLIAACTLGLALAIFIFSKFVISPKYEADASVAVNAIEVAGNFEKGSQSSDNFQLSQAILNSSVEVMKSSQVMDETIHSLGLDSDADRLGRDVKITPVPNSEVINIAVSYRSQSQVKQIEQVIIELSQQKMSNLYKGITVDIVAPPKLSDNVSPNVMLYTILGLLGGLFISCLWVFLTEKLSDKIKSEKALRELDLPVLGIIPETEGTQNYQYFADNLMNAKRSGDLKAVVMTSSLPGDDGHTVLTGITGAMHVRGQKALIIEASRNSAFLKNCSAADKAETIGGLDGERYCCCSVEGVPCVAAGGKQDMTAAEITEILDKTEGAYDLTLIHVPPVALFGNLPTYALLPVGFVLTVRQSISTMISTERARKMLNICNANLLGCVMTDYDYRNTDNYEEYSFYRRLIHAK